MNDSLCAIEQLLDIHAHQRGRDEAEVGERRIATADVGRVEKDALETIARRVRFYLGTGIGDGDEAFARILFALRDLIVPVLIKHQRLGRCARL